MTEDSIFGKLNDKAEPLVNDLLTFENILNNPVLKPISEAEKRKTDIEDMIAKKLTDIKRDKQWLEEAINDIPVYSDSGFIGRLLKVNADMTDIIKLQDINVDILKNTIREMMDIIKQRYGILEAEDISIPAKEQGSKDYKLLLEEEVNSSSDIKKEVASAILELFMGDNRQIPDESKFKDACISYYQNEQNKEKKKCVAPLMEKFK